MNDLLFIHKISSICDYIFPGEGEYYDKQWGHTNKPLKKKNLHLVKPYSIIFAALYHLDLMPDFFNNINVPFIIISAESDHSVPYINYSNKNELCKTILNNDNLIRWYSINVDYIHPKLIHIPLGLPKHVPIFNSDHMGWRLNTDEKMMESVTNNLNISFLKSKENLVNKDKNLLFFKMTIINNDNDKVFHQFKSIRRNSITKLIKNGFIIDNSLVHWDQYIFTLKNSKFCLSLPGAGIDCYRTWEALTVGVIPIVIRSGICPLYDDLPVLIIDDIDEITHEFLNKKFDEITENIEKYNWKKLTSSYWINKIKEDLDPKNINLLQNFKGSNYRLVNNWYDIIPLEIKPIKYLEIGAFQGANLISFAETYGKHENTKLYCIDPWIDYDNYTEYKGLQDKHYNIFIENIKLNKLENKVQILRGFSNELIPTLDDNFFDIIYIDGNHEPEYVLEDAVLSFRKLKIGGYLIFDDYGFEQVHLGIEAFVSAYCNRIQILKMYNNMQTFLIKIK